MYVYGQYFDFNLAGTLFNISVLLVGYAIARMASMRGAAAVAFAVMPLAVLWVFDRSAGGGALVLF
jgi:hypothetical protein